MANARDGMDAGRDITWVKGGAGQPYVMRTAPLDIKADPEVVWGIVKNLNQYSHLSNGVIDAHIDGAVIPGGKFDIDLYKGTCAGFFIPRSTETIHVVDNEQKILGWERELPCSSHHSERFHVLETLPEQQGTRSSIGLHIPGGVGFFTKKFMGRLIEQAFTNLNEGIKQEAEALQSRLNTPSN